VQPLERRRADGNKAAFGDDADADRVKKSVEARRSAPYRRSSRGNRDFEIEPVRWPHGAGERLGVVEQRRPGAHDDAGAVGLCSRVECADRSTAGLLLAPRCRRNPLQQDRRFR
jgi:hypothetical protein